MSWAAVMPRERLIYGDFMAPDADVRVYEEIDDTDRLTSVVEVRFGADRSIRSIRSAGIILSGRFCLILLAIDIVHIVPSLNIYF